MSLDKEETMAARSEKTPWKTAKWHTSPWNFLPEVTKDYTFPAALVVHDVTLRDGEQQAGIEFTKDEKVRIAEALAEAGVHRIEAGMPAVSASDAEAIREIVKLNLPCDIVAFSRCMVEDVQRAIDCGVKRIVMEIPSSRHLTEEAYKWPMDKAIELSIAATRYAHEQGLYVSYFPIDASRADITEYMALIERIAREGWMDAIGCVDTFGVLTPQATSFFVRETKKRINKPVETHFHMDFGMGVANTVAAVTAGADVIQTTVGGIGERAGNTPMEETLLALLTLYDVQTRVKTEQFRSLSRLVRMLAGMPQAPNRSVVGDQLFNVESGIIANWVKNVEPSGQLTYPFPFLPELVGHEPVKVVLGKGSGIDSIHYHLDKFGMRATDEEAMALLLRVKQTSLERKALIDLDEFRRWAEATVSKQK
jgi:isopropylmalate/homocitrate/citramalate synthase